MPNTERSPTDPVTTSDPTGTVTVDGVPIFAAGVWNGVKIQNSDLDSMVASYEALKDVLHPPLKLGHSDDQQLMKESGLPAIGWVSKVQRVGSQILATFTDVPRVVADLIKKKAYRFVSPEVLPLYKYNDAQYPWTLWGVAILGNEVPAIKTLGDISKLFGAVSEKFSSMVMKFEDNKGVLSICVEPHTTKPVPSVAPALCSAFDKLKLRKFSGNTESVKKGWETRKGGTAAEPAKPADKPKLESGIGLSDIKDALKEAWLALHPTHRLFSQKKFDGDGGGGAGAGSDSGGAGSSSGPNSGNSGAGGENSSTASSEYHQPSAMNKISVSDRFNRSKKAKLAGAMKGVFCQKMNALDTSVDLEMAAITGRYGAQFGAWVQDEDIWDKAKKAVDPEGAGAKYDNPWAVTASVYKRMGGRVHSEGGKK